MMRPDAAARPGEFANDRRRFGAMTVQKTLDLKQSRSVATISPFASVRDALRMLEDWDVGALVVSEDGVRVNGILSERDIVRALRREGAIALDGGVSRLMTKDVFTCAPEDRNDDIMAAMSARKIRHVPVVKDGKLCGLVSSRDVLNRRVMELDEETQMIREFITAA